MRRFPEYKVPIKLNVGCGEDNRLGYINIDKRDLGFNTLWDVRDGLPFTDGSVVEIFSSHFLEHLDDDESEAFFREAFRVLKSKGELIVRVPHATSTGACIMGHKTFWNEEKVLSLQGFDRNPIGNFIISENKEEGGQLLFTLKKL
jgi:predicted SAM-dependent methyltransferase